MSGLEFRSVTVSYGAGQDVRTVIDDVSLCVRPGEIVGLVGESGSGKSTLARAALGFLPLAAGAIQLDGIDIGSRRSHGELQLIFQDPFASLDPRMSIGETIAEAVPRKLIARRDVRRQEVQRLLSLVGLPETRMGIRPSQLSGGQRQRVAIARALASAPRIIIADEITSALDVSVQGTILNLVRDLQRRLNVGMLFISHNFAVVRYVSDRIAVLHEGRIVESRPSDDILERPQHPYTRMLIDAARSSAESCVAVGEAPGGR